MAVLAEVIRGGYYTRNNGAVKEADIGTKLVVKAIPKALETKLKKVKDVDDSQLIVNDNPEAAKFRDEGKAEKADKIMNATPDEAGADEEVSRLRAAYTDLTGEEPDKRWKPETLNKKISEAAEKNEE